MTTPADEIRAAAARLRELATVATPGTWTAHLLPPNEHHKHPAHWVETEYEDDTTVTSQVVADCPWRQADANYIATMHPGVGQALADWLDLETRKYDAAVRAADEVFHDDPDGHADFLTTGSGAPAAPALTIARLINQEQQ